MSDYHRTFSMEQFWKGIALNVTKRNATKTPLKVIIWKAQVVPQYNNAGHPKHPEEGETIADKLALSSPTEVIDPLQLTYK